MGWLAEEWDRPNRTDHYLMRVAYEIRVGNVKKPRSVKFEDFRLKFLTGDKKTEATRKAAKSKSSWLMVTGFHGYQASQNETDTDQRDEDREKLPPRRVKYDRSRSIPPPHSSDG